tara:strand:- start:8163 stop:9113 length:951 start_codon:yes stop_codon:yes gene_type:complete
MTLSALKPFGIVIVVALCAALLPFIAGPYGLALAINMAMYVALCTAWVLFSGPTGYASLATVAFFGLGMYIMAIFAETLPWFAILPITLALSGLAALIVGGATLRLTGVHFVIFTFGLAELVRQLVTWEETTFAGNVGRYVFVDTSQAQIYWQLVGLSAALFCLGSWLQTRRAGWALRAIGADETAARHMGINTTRVKLIVFVLSAMAMALVGMIMAPRWTYIDPTIAFSPVVSFQVLIMCLLGGTGRLWGPLLGVIPLVLVTEILQANMPTYFSVFLGAIFLVTVYLLPGGVVGLVERLHGSRRNAPDSVEEVRV